MQAERPRILIADDDADVREALSEILSGEGYDVRTVASAEAAIEAQDSEVYRAVLTDVFADPGAERLKRVDAIVERARPIPVAVVSGWPLSDGELREHGLRFAMQKPFDISALLMAVAQMLGDPLDPKRDESAALVKRYFDALGARDWDGLVALCADDVRFEDPLVRAGELQGREAFRRHAEETFSRFQDAKFDDLSLYATPGGVAARYLGSWVQAGERVRLAGTALLQIEAGRIARIGVVLNQAQLDRLAP